MVNRLPQAALCRSPRPGGFLNFSVCNMNLYPSFLNGGKIALVPTSCVARERPIEAAQVIVSIEDREDFSCRLGHCVPP
jgi:hypothetical protein